MLSISSHAGAGRDYGGYYTAERLANARINCDKYEWAAAVRSAAVTAAKPWVEVSDDDLWAMAPGQKLPRAIDVSMHQGQRPGCPECGTKIDKFGNYPYNPDIWKTPWKITCPSCGVVFPKNDFGKYYATGIDETGVFDPEKADRSLLFNTEHPDPNDPLHTYGVDDGFGWFSEDGHRYLFVAYYTYKYWEALQSGVYALGRAYVFTGEQRYAHKALVLLDRIADLYPDYDWAPYAAMGYFHSDGGSGKGKIEGRIWETGTVTTFAQAIDAVLSGTGNDPELLTFLAAKSKQYRLPRPKGTREALVSNLDDGILREGARAVMAGQVAGNEGMTQRALAACAIALDTEPETGKWLDWLFEPDGGHIPTVLIGGVDRDGVGAEAAPGYALGWGANMGTVADMLADYGKYTRHSIYRDIVPFRATFTAGWQIACLGYSTPNIGDTGSCGSIGMVTAAPDFIARGYRYLGDPQIGLAAFYAKGRSAEGLGRDIFSADPERVEREIAELGRQAEGAGNPWEGGHNLAGYGLASLEYGWGKPGTALWMYYGRNSGHGHPDRLNLDIFYQGYCMMPDHGYPEFATNWPHRRYVTDNTIAHNTVVVNEQPQQPNWVGHPELFCQTDDFAAMRVDSREVYQGVSQYQRTLAFVKVGEGQAYALDVFRVRGGDDHVYSLHGLPGEVTVTGMNLQDQSGGSYAGPEVAPRGADAEGRRCGYSWITDVARDSSPAASFIVDWKGEAGYRGLTADDDLHLRYHSFSELSDVAMGNMTPPQNKKGNPESLRYVLAHRQGPNLASTFVGLLEPYRDQPVIARAERLALQGAPEAAAAVALKVTLTDGTVDYLVASDDDQAVIRAEGGLEWAGAVGWLRVREGRVVQATLSRGARLVLGDFALTSPAAGQSGKVVRMTKDMGSTAYVWVDTPLPAGNALAGQQMIIANDRVRNACYEIESVDADGDLTRVSLGQTSFVRGFANPKRYDKGYVYDFAEGAEFIIPLSAAVKLDETGRYAAVATMPVSLSER